MKGARDVQWFSAGYSACHCHYYLFCIWNDFINYETFKQTCMKTERYIRIIKSSDANEESIIEMNIFPREKTPWHYHTRFSERFEILKGRLTVGKGRKVLDLKQKDTAQIQVKENHYYHNAFEEECIVRVTISPANQNFENALLILIGLAKDDLVSYTGTPRKLSDLALFIYLSNSRIPGFKKIAEPIFKWLAKSNIENGHLELMQKYVIANTL